MPSGAVTFTVTVQELLAVIVPFARLMVPDPATAVTVALQFEVKPFGVATTRLPGSVSVKATPVSETKLFGFVIWKLTVDVPPGRILTGVNVFVMLGGATTRSVAAAVFPVPPSLEVTLLVT